MLRILISLAVGSVFVLALLFAFFQPREEAAEDIVHKLHQHPKEVSFHSDGPFGTYDRQQLQRGLKVFQEVCAACHGARFLAFRNFEAFGYSEPEVKALAQGWPIEQPSINPDTGERTTRPNMPADHLPSPYDNEVAARAANNNALPPDLSLIAKNREGGAHYVYSLLTGYQQPPADLPAEARPGTGLYYNPYFANLNIAMPPPLTSDGQVTYDDGTEATIDQMAKDVAAFLTWAAEPKMEKRKQTGFAVLIFLLIATALAYMSYRNIWADKKH